FLLENKASIEAFQSQRQIAFETERQAWEASGEFDRVTDLIERAETTSQSTSTIEIPEGADLIEAPLGGSVWKLLVEPGDEVAKGDVIAVIEAMKMECPLESPDDGSIAALYIQERQAVQPGTPMVAIRRSV
ncbi:MAG: acetyl-CoA carboxylase biotin carboxyl carrier protein subunit, partial [Pseudomonadota bacterium]